MSERYDLGQDERWELVDRYLAGQATQAEQVRIRAWLESDPIALAAVNGVKSGNAEFLTASEAPSAAESLGRMHARIAAEHRSSSAPKRWSAWWNVAWVVPLLSLLGIKYAQFSWKDSKKIQEHSYSTRPGERATVTLAGGARIAIAPATQVLVKGHSITLNGEAMFTVLHRSNEPFVVYTGNSVTRVLGTTFGVRRYPSDKTTQVVVTEGKVALNDAVVTAGDIATTDANGSVGVTHDAERAIALLAFAQGRLVIDAQPLVSAVPQIERWLNLDIELAPGVSKRMLSVTLSNETAEQALSIVSSLTNTSYTRNGRKVMLTDLQQ